MFLTNNAPNINEHHTKSHRNQYLYDRSDFMSPLKQRIFPHQQPEFIPIAGHLMDIFCICFQWVRICSTLDIIYVNNPLFCVFSNVGYPRVNIFVSNGQFYGHSHIDSIVYINWVKTIGASESGWYMRRTCIGRRCARMFLPENRDIVYSKFWSLIVKTIK